jgi:K+/H+ antiporter YhaU regulatory subunit KhtT
VDKTLAVSHIRSRTGCNVIAICDREAMCINPEPSTRMAENNELILIGNDEAESRFFKMYSEMKKIKAA